MLAYSVSTEYFAEYFAENRLQVLDEESFHIYIFNFPY